MRRGGNHKRTGNAHQDGPNDPSQRHDGGEISQGSQNEEKVLRGVDPKVERNA